jgi:hypothetical protein
VRLELNLLIYLIFNVFLSIASGMVLRIYALLRAFGPGRV